MAGNIATLTSANFDETVALRTLPSSSTSGPNGADRARRLPQS